MTTLEGAAAPPRENPEAGGAIREGDCPEEIVTRPGAKSGRAIGLNDSVGAGCSTCGFPGRIGSPFLSAPGGKAVRQPAPPTVHEARPPRPIGAQPIHPGPEYQLTKAGLQALNDPGIQNHPIAGLKFQNP
jgi:hypothetical protein